MSREKFVLVIGLGEVGEPLLRILETRHRAIGIGIEPVEIVENCDFMHVCYPFQDTVFVDQTVAYIDKYNPQVTVINSTVAPGTTRAIHERTGYQIAHSPVRGKHSNMREELVRYTKLVGGINDECGEIVARHFQSVGMDTKNFSSPEATELAKLTETTYFAIMIAWAQEVERYCDALSLEYDEVVSIYEGIGFFPPVKYFPGVIGGHCVMPNIEILSSQFDSNILDSITHSNNIKIGRDALQIQSQ